MNTLLLVRIMTKRSFIMFRRYAFDTLSGIITIYLFFLLIFYGARALLGGQQGYGDTLSGIVVGFFIWILAIFTYSELSFDLVREATEGTLEQLSMSPMGLTRVLVARFVAGLGLQLALLATLLVLMMASTGRWLHLDVVSLVPLVVLTMTGVLGVGFVMGGLAIVFKRIQSSLQILQFLFPVLLVAPLERFPAVKYLPLSWGNRLISSVMVDGTSIFSIAPSDLGFLVLNSAVWMTIGVIVFKRFERIARQRGLLAHY